MDLLVVKAPKTLYLTRTGYFTAK